ncbi:glycosyltransferase [Sphingomonas glaciei]|uniref:Glycosyltransferase n=1 Tax=Sphingomonas glaciei TaxID=2938948 RepID=A0ABY5MUD7_9SPHN|nr:glycosyltransferase [Sphingomonas glaciei]UUR08109.1 glycosyltransferase [Sphingomonas glaciei]
MRDLTDNTPLRIAVIAHVRHPVAAPFMGGMEAHCETLVRALVADGHDVTLFASGDSDPSLPVHAICPRAYEAELPWATWHGTATLREWLLRTYRGAWEAIVEGGFDVVHNNALFPDLLDWASRDRVAMVTSLHVPPFRALGEAVARNAVAPWQQLTVCSSQQQALWPAGTTRVALNGIDIARWPFEAVGGGRAIWVGRITPTKGTLEAIDAAEAARVPLDIVGPIDCRDYWVQVSPRIRAPHRYLGHLSGAALTHAVQGASVLVATPMWDEPFGLTMVEAMACGVPVAALGRGAIPEVVGDAGVVVASPADLPQAIRGAMEIDRTVPRARVERHFSAAAMIGRYREAYASAIAGLRSVSSIESTRALLA